MKIKIDNVWERGKKKTPGYNQYVWYFAASKVCIKNLLRSLNILLESQVIKYEFQVGKRSGERLSYVILEKRWALGDTQDSTQLLKYEDAGTFSAPEACTIITMERNTRYEAHFLLTSGFIL